MTQIDYTTPLGAARLKEEIESGFRILGGQRMRYIDSNCYNVTQNVKAKRKGILQSGTIQMSKASDSKGKVNTTKINISKTYVELEQYDVQLCFDYEELNYLEGDIWGATQRSMMEADDRERDLAAIDALFGKIMRGDPCKVTLHRDLCHIPHNGQGLSPDKILTAVQAIGSFYPGSRVIVGMPVATSLQLAQFPEFTNNDFLTMGGDSAYAGMMKKWHLADFKMINDHWNTDDLNVQQEGHLVPTIPAAPYLVGGNWDGETFVRFLPVWVKDALMMVDGYGPEITPMPDAWKYKDLTKGVGTIRIDDQFGFNAMQERARAVICVLETNKQLAESYVRNRGEGFGTPAGIENL